MIANAIGKCKMNLNWSDMISLTSEGVSNIRQIAGVYRLSYLDGNNRPVYYVGQAEDLHDRLSQHLQGAEINEDCCQVLYRYPCYFRAAVVVRKEDRDAIEAALYQHFKPTCCERIPNCAPADINY